MEKQESEYANWVQTAVMAGAELGKVGLGFWERNNEVRHGNALNRITQIEQIKRESQARRDAPRKQKEIIIIASIIGGISILGLMLFLPRN